MSSIAVGSAPNARAGLLLGLLGVLAFSLTLPMTRVAVAELDASFVAFGRMAIAGLVAVAWLIVTRARAPARRQWAPLAWASLGIVFGFPLLSSLAMRSMPASHGAIVNGLLPFTTALFAAALHRDRQGARFWICAAIGSAIVIAFALREGNATLTAGDLWMLGAVVLGALGYVMGGRLAAAIGGIDVILWALAIALPISLPIALALAFTTPLAASAPAWSGFVYVALVSQLVGFFAWYNGLALGGIARVGQVQLLQVFFTIAFAALLFGERVEPATWLAATAVVACIAVGRWSPKQEAR
ncbi:MAG: DMT family transporter [Gemmatimonadota bacterium]